MAFRHDLAQKLIRCWPVETGLWRLMKYAPPTDSLEKLVVRPLRGFPLKLKFSPYTYSGRNLYYRGMYEGTQTSMLNMLLKPGDNFIDIGANVGLYSVVAGHCVGSGGRVLAIEPQEHLAGLVRENAELNGLDNVTVCQLALGAESGMGFIHQTSPSNDGAATLRPNDGETVFGESRQVTITTLDELLDKHEIKSVAGMKIDVEGAELEALKGFTAVLRSDPPRFIFVECIDDYLQRFGGSTDELLDFLRSLGYEVRCRHRGSWRPVSSAEDHARCRYSPDFFAMQR